MRIKLCVVRSGSWVSIGRGLRAAVRDNSRLGRRSYGRRSYANGRHSYAIGIRFVLVRREEK